MFEGSLITLLAADATLQTKLSTYQSSIAIFSNSAPQDVTEPYIVIDIDKYETENLPVSGFRVTLDIWDRTSSCVVLREIAERIEFICDRYVITGDSRFNSVRLAYTDGREVENSDILIKHYVVTLTARAGRSKWAGQL